MWTLTEKRMLFHVVGSAMENHHLKRSVLCIFFFVLYVIFCKAISKGSKNQAKNFFHELVISNFLYC